MSCSGISRRDLWLMRMGVHDEPCATNNACFPFDEVNFAVCVRNRWRGGCVNGCNVGADKGPSGPAGCTNFQGAAAWFKVKTDDVAEVLSIRVRHQNSIFRKSLMRVSTASISHRSIATTVLMV